MRSGGRGVGVPRTAFGARSGLKQRADVLLEQSSQGEGPEVRLWGPAAGSSPKHLNHHSRGGRPVGVGTHESGAGEVGSTINDRRRGATH